MKKIILALFLLFSLTILAAVEKSGIKEFDSLVYSKGKTITYFDDQGNSSKTAKGAYYERKVFEYKTDVPEPKMFIVADYYVSNKQPAYVFITAENFIYEFEPEAMVPGVIAVWYEDGTLARE